MKNEALKELQNALNDLKLAKESGSDSPYIDEAIKHLNHAFFLETPRSTGKFNIYDWCADDDLRPALNCVFHDEGFEIASNGHLLVCLKSDYAPELEGKLIDRVGENYDGRYPNYKSVKPTKSPKSAEIDPAKVWDALKEYKVRKKAAGKHGDVPTPVLRVNNEAYFNLNVFSKFITFMEMKNNFTLKYEDYTHAAICECEDGSWALVMPLLTSVIIDSPADYTITDIDKK